MIRCFKIISKVLHPYRHRAVVGHHRSRAHRHAIAPIATVVCVATGGLTVGVGAIVAGGIIGASAFPSPVTLGSGAAAASVAFNATGATLAAATPDQPVAVPEPSAFLLFGTFYLSLIFLHLWLGRARA